MTDKTQTGVTRKQLAIVPISMIDEPTIIMNMVGREVPFLINTRATYSVITKNYTDGLCRSSAHISVVGLSGPHNDP